MTESSRRLSLLLLRWTVGVVVLIESARFVISAPTVRHLTTLGLPPWIRFALGGAEVVAALLFLAPYSQPLGGKLLLVVFAFAILLHLLHGLYDIGGLAVYAAAVWTCVAHDLDKRSQLGWFCGW